MVNSNTAFVAREAPRPTWSWRGRYTREQRAVTTLPAPPTCGKMAAFDVGFLAINSAPAADVVGAFVSFGVARSSNSSCFGIDDYGQCFDSIELRGNGF